MKSKNVISNKPAKAMIVFVSDKVSMLHIRMYILMPKLGESTKKEYSEFAKAFWEFFVF